MRSERQKQAVEMNRIRWLEIKARDRFYISLNIKGSYNPKTGKYTRHAWPILFASEEAAWKFARLVDPFLHATGATGRIVSYTVEKVRRNGLAH